MSTFILSFDVDRWREGRREAERDDGFPKIASWRCHRRAYLSSLLFFSPSSFDLLVSGLAFHSTPCTAHILVKWPPTSTKSFLYQRHNTHHIIDMPFFRTLTALYPASMFFTSPLASPHKPYGQPSTVTDTNTKISIRERSRNKQQHHHAHPPQYHIHHRRRNHSKPNPTLNLANVQFDIG